MESDLPQALETSAPDTYEPSDLDRSDPSRLGEPDAALRSARDCSSVMILDLDETLYLRNSSQDFLAHAWPAPIAVSLIRAIERIKPWRKTGDETADVWRTLSVTLLMPWVWLTWGRTGRALGKRHANDALIGAANDSTAELIVATLGFTPIVAPIVKGLGLRRAQIVGCRLFSFRDRKSGKLAVLQRSFPPEVLNNAMVITDSVDDQDLLAVCKHPIRVIWPGARYVPAASRLGFPFEYTARIKRPGQRFVTKIFKQDFACWVLASVGAIVAHPLNLVAVPFLFVAFWSVYEIGYLENDLMSERETDGVRSETFDHERLRGLSGSLYLSALVTSLIGLLLAKADLAQTAGWVAALAATRITYFVFNRVDKATRSWLYLPLQVGRIFSIAAVFPMGGAAKALCAAFAVAQWMAYIIYRERKVDGQYSWPKLDVELIWLVLYALLLIAIAGIPGIVQPWTALQAALGFLIVLYPARTQLKRRLLAIRRI